MVAGADRLRRTGPRAKEAVIISGTIRGSGGTAGAATRTGARPDGPGQRDRRQAASWEYAESFVAEDDALVRARARAAEVGAMPVGPGGGAALRLVARMLDAKAVVEIGTGCGVSGIWLLRGMRPDGVLTSVDIEAEHQRLARESFAEAGFTTQRARLITGRALEVLPRLTDGAYDLVFCDGEKTEYPEYLEQSLRLLRVGGVVALDNTLWQGRVADPAQRDATTVTIRELGRAVAQDERLVPALLPVGDGLLCAVKQG